MNTAVFEWTRINNVWVPENVDFHSLEERRMLKLLFIEWSSVNERLPTNTFEPGKLGIPVEVEVEDRREEKRAGSTEGSRSDTE